ncbi:hypothetical protein PF049_03840 [Erythrobacteraceae bacterium WH01K]|nr:hypothetical protein PF049_03840 [Erythrobacteraceae bacterium WH01K]
MAFRTWTILSVNRKWCPIEDKAGHSDHWGKTAYRNAARTLHPDIGGNALDMVALNAAFARVLDILMLSEAEVSPQTDEGLNRHYQNGTRGGSSFACGPVCPGFWPGSILQYPRSALEFDILLRTEALLAATDLFDEDRHARLALGLAFNPAWSADAGPSGDTFDKADACEKVADLLRIAIEATKEPALPQGLPGLHELGQIWIRAAINAWIEHGRISERENLSLKKLQTLEEQALEAGRFPFVEEWREKRLRTISDRIDQPGSRSDDRFQLNHSLQAKNALRRGLITAARYKTTVARLEERHHAIAGATAAIVELASGPGFMALEHDPDEAEKTVSVRFVPESVPGSSFGNWKLDSKQACRAYGEAYYRSEAVEGKLKFIRQRLWILLSSLVAKPASWDADRILAAAHEVALLGEAARASREGEAGNHAADLHEFLKALAAEDAPQREERLRALRGLAREDFRDHMPEGVEAVSKGSRPDGRFEYGSPLMQVIPSQDYYRSALRPVDELKAFSAGQPWSDPEREAEQEGIRYYYDHMQKLSDRMFNAVDVEPAKKKIAKLAPLIREAVSQSVPLNAAAEWQLGYYIDRLTGAMVRARQFAEALTVLEEYFALPDAYRRRSTPSEEKRLRARLARCRRDAARA